MLDATNCGVHSVVRPVRDLLPRETVVPASARTLSTLKRVETSDDGTVYSGFTRKQICPVSATVRKPALAVSSTTLAAGASLPERPMHRLVRFQRESKALVHETTTLKC